MSHTDTDKPSVDVTAVEHSKDADIAEQASIFNAFVVTVQHLFGGFQRLFQGVTDPRHPAYITYPLPALMVTGVLMFLLRLGARRQVGNLLRGNGPSAAKYQILFGVESCPHGDTLNYLYGRSDVAEVQEVVTSMTETLIRRKVLYRLAYWTSTSWWW
jgi:hypothetical protein